MSRRLVALLELLRRLAGMPDYDAYCRHQRACHAASPALSEREFFAEYLRARYGEGTSRCC